MVARIPLMNFHPQEPEYSRLIKPRIETMVKSGGGIVFESAHVRKDGTVMPVEVHSRVIEFDGRKLVVSVARDIAERKKVEESLRQSEERYRTLAEAAHDAIFIVERNGYVAFLMRSCEGLSLVRLRQLVANLLQYTCVKKIDGCYIMVTGYQKI